MAKVDPLRLIVAGTAGTGKTLVIQVINALAQVTSMLGNKSVTRKNVAPSSLGLQNISGSWV
eukprot:677362-Rhodomonas_salina.1